LVVNDAKLVADGYPNKCEKFQTPIRGGSGYIFM